MTRELNKTLSANVDANGIGASVNLRTKTARAPDLGCIYGRRLHQHHGWPRFDRGGSDRRKALRRNKRFGSSSMARMIQWPWHRQLPARVDPYSTLAAPFYDSNPFATIATIATAMECLARGFQAERQHQLLCNASTPTEDWGDKWYYKPVSQLLSAPGVYSSKAARPAFIPPASAQCSVGTLILAGVIWEASPGLRPSLPPPTPMKSIRRVTQG